MEIQQSSLDNEYSDLNELADFLICFRERETAEVNQEFIELTSKFEQKYIGENDSFALRIIWCFNRIDEIHRCFVSAFFNMKKDAFYDSWCDLVSCEEKIDDVRGYMNDPKDLFGLLDIEKYVKQFQGLYPYSLFLSPGMRVRRCCNICKEPVSPRKGCNHIVGEFYSGKMCRREVVDAEILEISIVTSPENKRCVLFQDDIQYNYGFVKYVIDGLADPWKKWSSITKDIYPDPIALATIGRNQLCICGSELKYKKCCLHNPKPIKKHIDIIFEEWPSNLPRYIDKPYYVVETDKKNRSVILTSTV